MAKKDKSEAVEVEVLAAPASAKEGTVQALHRKVDKITAALENILGIDIDRDGKVGSARLGVLLVSFIVSFCAVSLFAADIAEWDAGSGRTGDAKITHDGTDYTLTIDKVAVDAGGLADGSVVAADLAAAVQDEIVDLSVSSADQADGTADVTIQLQDIGNNSLADRGLIRLWVAATDMAAPSTNNVEGITVSTGTQIEETVAAADYTVLTDTNGTAVVAVNLTADGTNYIMVTSGGLVNSAAVAVTGN